MPRRSYTQPKPMGDAGEVWLSVQEVVALIKVNRAYLLKKDGAGNYVHFPQIARLQWRDKAKVYFLQSQIIELKRNLERAAIERTLPAQPATETGAHTYAPIAADLVRLGGRRTMKALGIE